MAQRRRDSGGGEFSHAEHGLELRPHERGDVEAAEAAYRDGDERGESDTATNLGILLQRRGDLDGAEAGYRRGDQRGDAQAAFNLGLLLRARGDNQGAEAAYLKAIEIAQQQEARMHELRAATELARLGRTKATNRDPRMLLEPILNAIEGGEEFC